MLLGPPELDDGGGGGGGGALVECRRAAALLAILVACEFLDMCVELGVILVLLLVPIACVIAILRWIWRCCTVSAEVAAVPEEEELLSLALDDADGGKVISHSLSRYRAMSLCSMAFEWRCLAISADFDVTSSTKLSASLINACLTVWSIFSFGDIEFTNSSSWALFIMGSW